MTINDQPNETTQLQEETSPSGDAVIVDEAHQVGGSEGAPSSEEEQPSAPEDGPPTDEPPEGAVGAFALPRDVIIHQEDEPLTCAVCNNPIGRNVGYLQAAYRPVHYTDCSHQSKPV